MEIRAKKHGRRKNYKKCFKCVSVISKHVILGVPYKKALRCYCYSRLICCFFSRKVLKQKAFSTLPVLLVGKNACLARELILEQTTHKFSFFLSLHLLLLLRFFFTSVHSHEDQYKHAIWEYSYNIRVHTRTKRVGIQSTLDILITY